MMKFVVHHNICTSKGNLKFAMDTYEKILESSNCNSDLQSIVYRQLGWLYHCSHTGIDKISTTAKAIELLQKSVDLKKESWESWYYLGRCFAAEGRSHYAFLAYRQSIERLEASPDTWCSIGLLYQQQGQMTDALQAYICAVQLDSQHVVGWIDLGILYESANQLQDALTCYHQAVLCMQLSSERKSLESRIAKLYMLSKAPVNPYLCKEKTLPTLKEAFRLPIPMELVERAFSRGLINEKSVCPPVPDYSTCMPPDLGSLHALPGVSNVSPLIAVPIVY
jgi:histone demethylase